MKKKRLRFVKETLRLQEGHGWSSRPDCKIFVADRGAVRFDYPAKWVVLPDPDSIKFHDRKPPNDDCVLAFSYLRIPPIDWTSLPLAKLVEDASRGDERPITGWDPMVTGRRFDLEYAWRQGRFIDPQEKRPALTRICLARRKTVQALLTMELWEAELERFGGVWDLVLETLELDEPIADPTRGPRIM
jgi:hypothetical protein